ncbi:MAG: GC-type dockerin domain-anchored protein [Planctomycetota bacterium]
MLKRALVVCAIALFAGFARGPAAGQIALTTLLDRGDVFPQTWRTDITYRWQCQLPPCWDWFVLDTDELNRSLVLGQVYRVFNGQRFYDSAAAVVEPDGTQIPIVGPFDPYPAEGGLVRYRGGGFGSDGSVVLHYGRRETSTTREEARIGMLQGGVWTTLVQLGTPLVNGGTVPEDIFSFYIYSLGTSPVRQAFVGLLDGGPGLPDISQLYVIEANGVSLVAEGGETDASGRAFGRFDFRAPRVSDSGIVAVPSGTATHGRFIVYDGSGAAQVRFPFEELNAASDDLELHWVTNVSGGRTSWDIADNGRIAAVVDSTADGVRTNRLVEFTDDGPRVLLTVGDPAPGSSFDLLRIQRVRYTDDGDLIAWTDRNNGTFEKGQIVAFRPNGEAELVFEGFTNYPVFSTPAIRGFETAIGDSIVLDGYVSGGGSRLVRVSGVRPPCIADTNGDGALTPGDFNAWLLAYNTASASCDQNGDGRCTQGDFNAWILNFNAGC